MDISFFHDTEFTERDLIEFWEDNCCFSHDESVIRARQIACVVHNEGFIVGVSTAYQYSRSRRGVLIALRGFIIPTARSLAVFSRLHDLTIQFVQQVYPQSMLVIVAENPKFAKSGMQKWYLRRGWSVVGSDARGQTIWQLGNLNNG